MAALSVEAWLEATWEANGTDLHITAGAPPMMRVGGELVPVPKVKVLTPAETERLARELLRERADSLATSKDVDFGFTWRDCARIRGNAYRQRGSLSVALRLIPLRVPTMEELGLPAVLEQFLDVPSGLVLVTGPTGSGKSTTLASLIGAVNARRSCHIVTIEDPIEYLHRHDRALVDQRQIGDDADSFPDALRAALRQDPDVLLVGEMRDLDSIQTTLTIAETGHLVFASLHTNDTAQAIDRIIDVFPAERRPLIQLQLASTLQVIVYQRLLPRIDGGITAAYEVLVATFAVRNLIREGKSRQLRNMLLTGKADGMQTLEESLTALVAAGTVTLEDAMGASLHPADVRATVAAPIRRR
jgi:twitching motility protein PilT